MMTKYKGKGKEKERKKTIERNGRSVSMKEKSFIELNT